MTITDPNLDIMWYTLNNGMQEVPFLTNESIDETLWDSLSDGLNLITFYANDSVGNENSSSVTVIKDTAPPDIHINAPTLNYVSEHTPPAFNVEITDFLLNKTWYTVDFGVTKYFFTSNESIDTTAWDNAIDGIVSLTFYANDTLGNERNSTVYVFKDTTMPIIMIISPELAEIFNTTAPTFIVEAYDANPVRKWYTINESLTEYTFTVNGSINQAAWDALPEGDLILRFYFEDIAGHISSDFVGISKKLQSDDGNGDGDGDTTGPDIHGYSLVLLIPTIWIMSTIILVFITKKIKKK